MVARPFFSATDSLLEKSSLESGLPD